MAAAAEVFAQGGIDAPLSAVAKKAGVGQGSLYRHFPDRVTLALATFERNVAEIETLAGSADGTLSNLLALITRQTIDSIAFVDIVTTAADPRLEAVSERVKRTLTPALRDAQAAGTIRSSFTPDDLMLAIGMVAALVAKTPPARRAAAAESAWTLLTPSLSPPG
jgi:AcrR family transcriptional regulator